MAESWNVKLRLALAVFVFQSVRPGEGEARQAVPQGGCKLTCIFAQLFVRLFFFFLYFSFCFNLGTKTKLQKNVCLRHKL